MNWEDVISEVIRNPSISFRQGHALLIKEQTEMLRRYFTTLYDDTKAKKQGYSMETAGLSYAEILEALDNYDKNEQMV